MSALAVTGCTPGPRGEVPPLSLPPPPSSSAITPASGPPQQLVAGASAPAAWWRAFGSPALDALVERALAANSDLAAAEAVLRQAREQAAAAGGSLGPQVDAGYQAQRARVSRTLSNPLTSPDEYLYTLHTAQLTVSYPLDLFGGGRSRVRSARAAAAAAADRLEAARLTLIANLIAAVIQNASLAAQIEAADAAVRNNRDILLLLQRREMLGEIGAADVAAQQTALATAEAGLPPLRRQLAHQQGVIAVLIGVAPGAPLPPLPRLDDIALPARLPLAYPSAIVADRPDVRAARAQLEGAAADVGAAIAARLPNLQLNANLGGEATRFAEMFASGNLFWSLIGGITQPIFHSGQLRHQQRAAEAALDAAKAQYRSAALQSFADVSDALAALRTDADALDAADRARTSAARNLLLTRRQLALGAVGTLNLLNASAADAQARLGWVQARAARLTDSVGLFQAIGGSPSEER